ncbi:PfkB family carbohydrate kinase [Klebsiella pneumoniae]|uniref:PfkB family carbohydrate kinase n=3 Tax=Klebsiella pneumoniae TaxID=573 RepID=UPI001246A1F3|nr:PfkB family carbohydrate kinase [Klebsiella pneumoniae]KAB0293080.1 DeoR family transcriptional regulator [Klebsiella pneumoniae]
MLPLERHRLIVELLGQHGVMRVNEIAQATRVSRETIRRDLSELERKGILTRSHGGALAAENPLPATRAAASALPVEDSQGSFQHRTLLHSEGKMRVARKALQFLQPGQTIVLDGSSTSWFLARQMPEMALTVITPSIRILQTLMSRRSLHLVGLGGDFSPTEESFFGETASRTLREYAIDTLFFSCQGLERDSVDAGKQAGALVILNPAPWQPVEHAVLSKVDLLTPNATEAGLMTGRRVDSLTAAAEAADVLHAQGARNVIITLGASGALLSELGVKSRVPCFPSHPRDTTGAGDAFNGALAARLACGEPLQAAARFAAAYAAVSVEKQGASSLPEYLEAQERLLRAAADYEMA